MQILCEGDTHIGRITSGFSRTFAPLEVHPDPVVKGDTPVDMFGTSIYGSVLSDGGKLRMWYQAWPDDWDLNDSCQVACVESEDGIHWIKPNYHLVDYHESKDNHLTDLPFHCPSVFIDPGASQDCRYRAFGFVNVDTMTDAYRFHGAKESGYYLAHSADGIHWKLDSDKPIWPYGDVITSVWDQHAGCARVFLKRAVNIGGIGRRSIFETSWKNGLASQERAILFPDEYDDLNAHAQGFQSADYYGMGTMPCSGYSIGFLWNFRHMSVNEGYGSTGRVDLSLVYQGKMGAKWNHIYGRKNWLCADDMPEWARGALYTASSPLDLGDQTWLYFTGTRDRHGWTGCERGYLEYLNTLKPGGGFAQIGIIKWQKDRLIGYKTVLRDRIELIPDVDAGSTRLLINAKTESGGYVRACVLDSRRQPIQGFTFADCDTITGDNPAKTMTWKGKRDMPFMPGHGMCVDVEVDNGTIYGYDFV